MCFLPTEQMLPGCALLGGMVRLAPDPVHNASLLSRILSSWPTVSSVGLFLTGSRVARLFCDALQEMPL
jgi:hypothetical protein